MSTLQTQFLSTLFMYSSRNTQLSIVDWFKPESLDYIYQKLYCGIRDSILKDEGIVSFGVLAKRIGMDEKYITECLTDCIENVDPVEVAEILQKEYGLKTMRLQIPEILKKSTEPKLAITEILKTIEKIQDKENIEGTMEEAYQTFSELGNKENNIPVGFSGIETISTGMAKGRIWVIGGHTGTGKSMIASQMALKSAISGKKTAIFSTEISKALIYKRYLKMYSGWNDIPEAESNKQLRQLTTMRIFDNLMKISEIELQIRKLKIQNDLDLVIIDQLQNIIPDEGKFSNMVEFYEKTTLRMIKLVKELSIGLIVLSQLTRTGEYYGSTTIGNMADLCLRLKRDKNEQGIMSTDTMIIIEKNRHGHVDNIMTQFIPKYLYFKELL